MARSPLRALEPTEEQEQAAVVQWCRVMGPETARIFHVPNGGWRSKRTAARLKAVGVRPGIPDLILPVARGGAHGLFIEMKARSGHLSPPQLHECDQLVLAGYAVVVAHGFEPAVRAIETYLRGQLGPAFVVLHS